VQLRPQTNGAKQGQKILNQTTTSSLYSTINKQKILEAVEKLNDKDLEKVSKILKVDQQQQDQNNEDE
jgi:Mg/Co/Ni transporter MgtE